MILVSRYLVPRGYNGIAIFPLVLVKTRILKTDKIFINHERIHLRQQVEMLIIFFFLWYIIEFLIRLLITKSWNKAYFAISFEEEAYTKEKDLEYLNSRSFWSFIKFL